MKCDIEKCKAECCGIVPFEESKFDESKLVRKVEIKRIEGHVIAVDEDNYCGFLGYDFKCKIYSERPEVCRKFGDESHICMTCRWEDKNGVLRYRAERRRLKRELDKLTDSLYKKK